MIIHPAEQGTIDWQNARLGIPTASSFDRIVTATGKPSKQAEAYIAELLAEHFLGQPFTDFLGTEWTERGHALEPEAFSAYGLLRDVDPQRVGFCYTDESKLSGCSPDGLVGDDGLLELKCPAPGNHLFYLAQGALPAKYRAQVQGQLWCTRRKWCDFMSYHPGLPPLIVRVHPEEKYQDALDAELPLFINNMLEARTRLEHMGVTAASPAIQEAAAPTNVVEAAHAAFARRD